MCGIVCAFDIKESSEVLRPQLLEMSKKVRHRGPDWSGIYADEKAILAHERLAIVDPASGKQPLFSPDQKLYLRRTVKSITIGNCESNSTTTIFKRNRTARSFSPCTKKRVPISWTR